MCCCTVIGHFLGVSIKRLHISHPFQMNKVKLWPRLALWNFDQGKATYLSHFVPFCWWMQVLFYGIISEAPQWVFSDCLSYLNQSPTKSVPLDLSNHCSITLVGNASITKLKVDAGFYVTWCNWEDNIAT